MAKKEFFAFVHLPKDRVLNVELSGRIDEKAKLPQLPLDSEILKVVLNLQDVTAINSIGVRQWQNWIRHIPPGKIEFTHCPRCIVDQFNMAMGFLPSGTLVSSILVPYYDTEAEAEVNILFRKGHEYDESKVTFHWQTTGSKGQALELDVIPRRYFQFLRVKLVGVGEQP